MSIAFSRSIRLMQRDSFRGGLIALALLLLFLAAWIAWFFLASIPLFAIGQSYTLAKDGNLRVTFSPADLANIRPGQKAVISLPGATGQPARNLEAEVMDIPPDGQGTVAIYPYAFIDPQSQPPMDNGLVKVRVGAVSPAEMIWQSAGQWLGK
jgi:hypothetical protein